MALASLAALTASEDPGRALRLAGAAVGRRERVGGHHPPGTIADLEAVRRSGDDSLGTETAEAEWEAGLGLDPEGIAGLVAGRPRGAAPGPLTARQQEVAGLVAEGLTNA